MVGWKCLFQPAFAMAIYMICLQLMLAFCLHAASSWGKHTYILDPDTLSFPSSGLLNSELEQSTTLTDTFCLDWRVVTLYGSTVYSAQHVIGTLVMTQVSLCDKFRTCKQVSSTIGALNSHYHLHQKPFFYFTDFACISIKGVMKYQEKHFFTG